MPAAARELDVGSEYQLPLVAAAEAARSETRAAAAAAAAVAPAVATASTTPAPAAPATAPAAAPTATAPTATVPAATVPALPRHERIGQEALDRLRFLDAAALGWTIDFHEGRDGYLGMADWETRTVDVWIRSSHDVQDVLGTLAHELAHVYDYEHWDDAVRNGWLAARGIDVEWWPPCTCDDREYGAGDIAEAMVILEAGAGEWTGKFGLPTQAQLDWLVGQL